MWEAQQMRLVKRPGMKGVKKPQSIDTCHWLQTKRQPPDAKCQEPLCSSQVRNSRKRQRQANGRTQA